MGTPDVLDAIPLIEFAAFTDLVAPDPPELPYASSATGREFVLHPPAGRPVTVYVPTWYPDWCLEAFLDYAAAQWGECPVHFVRVAATSTGAGAALLGFAQLMQRAQASPASTGEKD